MSILCSNAVDSIVELEHYGMPFSRTDDGKIYQRPFGGHMTNNGKGDPAHRACAAADRTGHALLHTLYQQSLKMMFSFLMSFMPSIFLKIVVEKFVVLALSIEDGSLHRFIAKMTILATGGYGRIFQSSTSAIFVPEMGRVLLYALVFLYQIWNLFNFIQQVFMELEF